MNLIKCSNCLESKTMENFYKNAKKLNGLDSQCKACISKRKSEQYKKKIAIKNKNFILRSKKVNRVLCVDQCTIQVKQHINYDTDQKNLFKRELARELLCHLKK